MTAALIVVIAIMAIVVLALVLQRAGERRTRRSPMAAPSDKRILFPFVAEALSERALDAALRLAAAEGATLVPVFLARVSLDLPLDTPLPRQCAVGVAVLEAIEQRATEAGVPVDSRIERGRNRRHALRQAIAQERFDQIVIAAASKGNPGFDADDIAWLIDNAQGEIIVLRPSAEDQPGLELARPESPEAVAVSLPEPERGEPVLSRAGETAGSR